jgi:hypothetical protein
VVVTGVPEQPSGRIELPARRLEPSLFLAERSHRVPHGRLAANVPGAAGGLQGDADGLPPVVEITARLKQRFRGVGQIPAQLDRTGPGRLADRGDQPGSFPLIPGQGTAGELPGQRPGQRPRRRASIEPQVAAAVVMVPGLVGEIEQGAERALQRGRPLGRRFLRGQALPGEHANQLVATVLTGLAGSFDQVGVDQLVEHVLGVGGRLVKQRGGHPAGKRRGFQQSQPPQQHPGLLAGTLVAERDARPYAQLAMLQLIEAPGLVGQPVGELLDVAVRPGGQPRAGDPQRQRQVAALAGDRRGGPGLRLHPAGTRDAPQQVQRLARIEHVHLDAGGAGQSGEPAPAGDQHRGVAAARKQR